MPFCNTGWQIVEGGDELSRTIEHRTGMYYIQDAASMLPAEMFAYEVERPLVLDMAASPGGKTTHLACKTNDSGLVIANDTSSGRIGALRSNLRDWGAIGASVTQFPGERFGQWFPEAFDAVLLDAPCSGESLRTAERRRTRPVSDTERRQLSKRQLNLLISALQAVKPGGQVVYATCTLAPEEDEAVLDALLTRYPAQAGIEAVERILPTPAPGLAADGETTYHPEIRHAVRLWPHLYDTSGFFAALVRKRDSLPVQPSTPPTRTLEQTGFTKLTRAEHAEVAGRLRSEFGFDLNALIERQALELWKRGKSVHAFPELFLARFADLPCAGVGLLIGERSDDFVPSHEFAARFSAQFGARRLCLDDDRVDKWLAGYDLREPGIAPYPAGTIVLVDDSRGRFLGRGKVLRDRIRNMLPKK